MPVLIFDPRAVNVATIRDELAAALDIPAPYVDVFEDRLEVVGMVDESMITAIQGVLDVHDPTPVVVQTTEEVIADLRAQVVALQKFTGAPLGLVKLTNPSLTPPRR